MSEDEKNNYSNPITCIGIDMNNNSNSKSNTSIIEVDSENKLEIIKIASTPLKQGSFYKMWFQEVDEKCNEEFKKEFENKFETPPDNSYLRGINIESFKLTEIPEDYWSSSQEPVLVTLKRLRDATEALDKALAEDDFKKYLPSKKQLTHIDLQTGLPFRNDPFVYVMSENLKQILDKLNVKVEDLKNKKDSELDRSNVTGSISEDNAKDKINYSKSIYAVTERRPNKNKLIDH